MHLTILFARQVYNENRKSTEKVLNTYSYM